MRSIYPLSIGWIDAIYLSTIHRLDWCDLFNHHLSAGLMRSIYPPFIDRFDAIYSSTIYRLDWCGLSIHQSSAGLVRSIYPPFIGWIKAIYLSNIFRLDWYDTPFIDRIDAIYLFDMTVVNCSCVAKLPCGIWVKSTGIKTKRGIAWIILRRTVGQRLNFFILLNT